MKRRPRYVQSGYQLEGNAGFISLASSPLVI